jgi:hypothetical protein
MQSFNSVVPFFFRKYSYLATEQAPRSRCHKLPKFPLPDGVGRYRHDPVLLAVLRLKAFTHCACVPQQCFEPLRFTDHELIAQETVLHN